MKRLATVLLVLAMGVSAQAAELGRLFYSPQQRSQIDAHRSLGDPDVPAPAANALALKGLVRRSDGKTTLWINDSQPIAVKSGLQPDRASVPLADGSHAEIRVGDKWQSGAKLPPAVQITRGSARADK